MRPPARANKPLETRYRWIGENATAQRIVKSGAFPASEFAEFFPNNAVEYFVSYYDYYQPEAYVPRTDTFIEKDANAHIHEIRLLDWTNECLRFR